MAAYYYFLYCRRTGATLLDARITSTGEVRITSDADVRQAQTQGG